MRDRTRDTGYAVESQMDEAKRTGEPRRILIMRPDDHFTVTVEWKPAPPPYTPPDPPFTITVEEHEDVDWDALRRALTAKGEGR